MGKRVVVSNCKIFLFYENHCNCNPLDIHLNFVYVMLIATISKQGDWHIGVRCGYLEKKHEAVLGANPLQNVQLEGEWGF